MSTPMNEPLLGGNGGGSGSQTPTGESQGRFSPGTLTRTSSWGAPGGGGVAGGAQGGVGGVGVGSVGAGDDAGAGGASGFSSGGGTGPGYYTRLESLARRKPGQPVRESARARRTTWTVIDATGRRTSVISDKRGIIQRFKLGIPIRDMRLMDASGALLAAAAAAGGAPAPAAGAAPLTPDAAVILVRDNAILVRMEHVRAIITANVVLIPSPETTAAAAAAAGVPLSAEAAAADAAAARFVAALRDAIVEAAAEARAHASRYLNGANSGGGGATGGGRAFHAGAAARSAGPSSPTQQQQQQQQQQHASSSSSPSPSHPGAAAVAAAATGLPPPHPPAPESVTESENEHEVAPLPFELAVLEAALRETTANQARMVAELEAVLSPALDSLTKAVSQPALERVRKLKTRHQRLLTRVQSVREELQRFLDDDDDMFRMCLTRKLELEERERAASAAAAAAAAAESADEAAAAAAAAAAGVGGNNNANNLPGLLSASGISGAPAAAGAAGTAPPPSSTIAVPAAARPGGAQQVPQSLFVGTPGTSFAFTRRPSVAFSRPAFSSAISSTFPPPLSAESAAAAEAAAAAAAAAAEEEENSEALETVENLLESYFMTVDGAYDRLVALDEFIQDTEEYINIELDSARNRLIRLDIVITAGSFGVAIFSLVAGILGENVEIPRRLVNAGFGLINFVTALVAVLAFTGVMAYIRYRRLF